MAIYNSEAYLKKQIEETREKAQNLKIEILMSKLFLIAKKESLSCEEYLFICDSIKKNKDNFEIK